MKWRDLYLVALLYLIGFAALIFNGYVLLDTFVTH